MSSRRRPEGRLFRSFRYAAAGARCEVTVGRGALGLLGAALPRIAPGRWFVVSSAPVLAAQGEALFEALAEMSRDAGAFTAAVGKGEPA